MSKESYPEDEQAVSRGRRALGSLVWLTGAIAFVILIQAFLVRPFVIPSESMLPTLKPGDRILVGRLGAVWHTPERGQVVVFHPPGGATIAEPRCGNQGGLYTKRICTQTWGGQSDDVFFVKRIVAIGGDRVSMKQGHVILNGKPVSEPYNHSVCPDPERCDFPETVLVPRGQVLLLGDNRNNSDDGRFWGTLPEDWITGPMIASWWPVNRLHLGQ
jgi:signal peptidase I